MTRDSVRFHVMGKNDVKRMLGMHAGGNGGELGDKRARHRNVGLRAINRVRPMNFHEPRIEIRLATKPVLRAHMHSERRARLFGIGHDVHLMTAFREPLSRPIGPHAHAALDRRILAYDADSQGPTSMRPALASSSISLSASHCSKVSSSTQSSIESIRSKIAGGSSNILG